MALVGRSALPPSTGRRVGPGARLLTSIVIAAALHAGLLLLASELGLWAPALRPQPATGASEPTWLELLEIDEADGLFEPAPEQPSAPTGAHDGLSGEQPSAPPHLPKPPYVPPPAALAMGSAANPSNGHRGAEAAPAPAGPALPGGERSIAPGNSSAASEAPALSLNDLGIGVENNPFLTPPSSQPIQRDVLNERLRHSLRSELAARDQQLGLGPEGPAVAAVKGIVLDSATTPNTSALLRLRTDADGRTVHVEVVEASNATDGWRLIADELKRALTGKKLRVPPGTAGVSMLLRVASRVQLPSGADPGLAVELFGQTVKAGEGDKSTKITILSPEIVVQEVEIPHSGGRTMSVPSLSLSILGVRGDLADIGAVARRLVSAHLVSMETHPRSEAAPPR